MWPASTARFEWCMLRKCYSPFHPQCAWKYVWKCWIKVVVPRSTVVWGRDQVRLVVVKLSTGWTHRRRCLPFPQRVQWWGHNIVYQISTATLSWNHGCSWKVGCGLVRTYDEMTPIEILSMCLPISCLHWIQKWACCRCRPPICCVWGHVIHEPNY